MVRRFGKRVSVRSAWCPTGSRNKLTSLKRATAGREDTLVRVDAPPSAATARRSKMSVRAPHGATNTFLLVRRHKVFLGAALRADTPPHPLWMPDSAPFKMLRLLL